MHFRRFACHQTTGRLRTFILVKTNHFSFWKARSTFRLVMKKSRPGPARSFKGREALHTLLRTTRNYRRVCWRLLPRQDLRISSTNLRNQSRHSTRRRYRLARTKSIHYWRPRRNTAFRVCRRANKSHTLFGENVVRRDAKAGQWGRFVFRFTARLRRSADTLCASLCFARRHARCAKFQFHPGVCLTTANRSADDACPARRNRTGR